MNDSIIPPTFSSRELPLFDDVLNDIAPYPYTLEAFKSYLARNHCSEFLEFLLDLREYSARYESAYSRGEPPTSQCDEPKQLLSLWRRLISVYINPGSSHELNLSFGEREGLLQYIDGIIPPPPSFIEEVVKRVHGSFQSSIFLLFLNSRLQPSTVDQADSVPAEIVSGIPTPSSRGDLLAHFSVDGSLDAAKQDHVEPSNNARQIDIHTTTEMTMPTDLSAPSDLKATFAQSCKVIKRWRSGVKMVVRSIFHR